MSEIFDFEDRWPELFDRLDARERNAVRQSLAAGWHEGFEPTREHVENMIDCLLGVIDDDEFFRRSGLGVSWPGRGGLPLMGVPTPSI